MRILVDASAAFNQGAGIGRASRNILIEARRQLPDADFVLWHAPERAGTPQFARELLERFPEPRDVIRARFSRRRADQLLFRARLPLPFQAFAGRGDIAYSPDFTSPHAWGIPNLVTIHDLAFMVRPDTAPEPLRRFLNAVVPAQIDRAARVVAVSETTKHDLIERLDVEPEKIAVISNGVESAFFDATPLDERHRAALGLPERYLLTVGTIEPRKNHLNLFAALDHLPSASALPLVVAGRVGWSADPILAASAPLQVRNRVMLLDYVPEALLPGLIAGAAALVYPSWYEGFGLPVLEALATGTPIVASDVPAHREIAADLAEYCDPGDPGAIAAAITSALGTEPSTSERRAARQARAREYSWSASGKKLTELMIELTTRKTSGRVSRSASRR